MVFLLTVVDGRHNFLRGVPHFAVAVAVQKLGKITTVVIYDPIKEELFWAEDGLGAFFELRKIKVVNIPRKHDTTLFAICGFNLAAEHENLPPLVRLCDIRNSGSALLDIAYVSMGRYDGCASFRTDYKRTAVITLMSKESGGLIHEQSDKSKLDKSKSDNMDKSKVDKLKLDKSQSDVLVASSSALQNILFTSGAVS